MAFEAVTFDGWDAGEFGDLGSREGGKKPGMFTANNMMRYRSALLGPRAGVRNLGVTGLPNGTIKALGQGTAGVVAVIGTATYSFDGTVIGSAATAWTGAAVSGAFSKPGEVVGAFSLGYLLNPFVAAYRLDHTAHTVTAVPAIPAGRCGCFYQDRLFIGGDGFTNAGRLRFSAPGAAGWETFAADGYLDLPQTGIITFMTPFRSGLLVGGLSNIFYYITGTIGFSSVVRALSVQGAPADTAKGQMLATDEVVYMATDRPYEGRFNGAIHSADKHLRWAGDNYQIDQAANPTYRVVKLIGPDDWLFLSGLGTAPGAVNRALMHYEGTHSYHTWEQNIGAWALDMGAGRTLLARDGTAGTPPVFYVFDPDLSRPGFATDADARPGDDSTTPLDAWVHLPQWFDPNGGEIQVRSVIVDFRKWNTGAATTNHFEVSARACNRYQQADALTSAVITFDEAGSASPTTGVDDRRTAFLGDQGSGGGFEVFIDHVRGVAIRSVTVEYERQPTRDL